MGKWEVVGQEGDCSLMNINNERTLEHGSFNIKSQLLQLENGINCLK